MKRAVVRFVAWVMLSPPLTTPHLVAQRSPVGADVILHNGKIFALTSERPVSAVAILKDRFVAIGSDSDLLALKGPNTRVIDLESRSVIPGLGDGHIHSKVLRQRENTVNLTPVRSMQALLEAIKRKVEETPPGDLIVTNSDWHEAQLEELRLPTRWDLDPVSPNHPVVVIRGGHEFILNSAALKKWDIDKDTKSPPGGQITFDSGTGDVTGELVDRARDLVSLPPPPQRTLEERLRLLRLEHDEYNSFGLTSIRNPGGSTRDFLDYQELAKRGELTVRVSFLIRWNRRSSAEEFKKEIEQWALLPQLGNEWIRFDGIKLGVDGGYEGGWMTRPYQEPYDKDGTYFGLSTVPRQQFLEIVEMLNDIDMRPSTHAVGDAAIDLVLDAYEAAHQKKSIRDRRWVIEHAFITRPEQIQRIQRLGLILSAQSHLYLAGASLLHYWGEERSHSVAPVRAWLDAGIHVAGGTDNKLPYRPVDPLMTFYHWVTRSTVSAGILGPEYAITRGEALGLATRENAYLTFEEHLKGSIEPGKLADLVVLSGDLMSVPAEELPAVQVLATMVGGRFVFLSDAVADWSD